MVVRCLLTFCSLLLLLSAGTARANPAEPLPSSAWQGTTKPPTPAALPLMTEPGEVPFLRFGASGDRLPLQHTRVNAKISGYFAEVEVAQVYRNTRPSTIEAVYVFPLPENSAVHHMRMVIGDRVIESEVQERTRARQTYESAKRAGHTAALLEQERPNVFTQSVANIAPGATVEVVVRYQQHLSYDAGRYEFVFPMVVGPRFHPGSPRQGSPSGSGTHPDTSRVPDASRVSPPYLGSGQRSGHDISVKVALDSGAPIHDIQAPTHQVRSQQHSDGRVEVELARADNIPNRDFVLRYNVAAAEPRAQLLLEPANDSGGYFALVVHPPALDVDRWVGQREVVFVVDVSGSMHGVPLSMCKRAMREALRRLRPADTFNVLTFAGQTQAAFDSPEPASEARVTQALRIIDGLSAGGGTHMADAVAAALAPRSSAGRHRYVFFLTDGYVGNEAEIIGATKRFVQQTRANGRRARVFGYGVGSSVNRHLIDGISSAGDGLAVYATPREDPAAAVDRFYRYIDQPVLEGLQLTGGLRTSETYPSQMPDLFASHAAIVLGRYEGEPDAVALRGRAADRKVEVAVTTVRRPPGGGTIGRLWARNKLAHLEQLLWEGAGESARRAITDLGIRYHLVTPFTSFVAVDRSRRVAGPAETVVQPLHAPEGVDLAAAGGVTAPATAAQPSGEGFGYSYDDDPLNAGGFTEEAAPSEADASEPPALDMRQESARVEPKRGCGCRSAGASSHAHHWLAASMALLAIAWWRRASIAGSTTAK